MCINHGKLSNAYAVINTRLPQVYNMKWKSQNQPVLNFACIVLIYPTFLSEDCQRYKPAYCRQKIYR